MKSMIFGGICFIGGLLMLLMQPTFEAGFMDYGVKLLLPAFTIFGLVLCIIGFMKIDEHRN